jgi:non-specific serine/threonine protein kinase
VLQLTGALADFWSARGFVAEGYRRLERALERDPAPTAARGRALNAAADLGGLSRVDPETAVYWAEQGLQLSRELGDRAGSVAALHCLAHAACDRGDFAGARGLIEEGLSLARELEDPIRVAAMTWMLGWACSGVGEVVRARELYEDALERARANELPTLEAIVLYTLSGRLLADDEADRALELIREVWELAAAHGDRARMSSTAWRLGSILAALGRPVDAALAHAAGTRSFEEMNGTVHPPAAEHLRTLERLRLDLGDDGLERQRQRAQELSLEEAVDAALGAA